ERWDQFITSWERILAEGGAVYGALRGDRLVGVAVLRPQLTAARAQLQSLFVSRAYRRQGVARRLGAEGARRAPAGGGRARAGSLGRRRAVRARRRLLPRPRFSAGRRGGPGPLRPGTRGYAPGQTPLNGYAASLFIGGQMGEMAALASTDHLGRVIAGYRAM